jgi:cytochrome c oxidase assembly protein subunit 15
VTNKKTLTEYLHRLTSGFYGIFVLSLWLWNFKLFPKKTAARQASTAVLVLMILEALLGAALVLKGLVGENATIFRLVVMTCHQMNSLLLTGSTVVLALVSRPQLEPETLHIQWRNLFSNAKFWMTFMVIPATGAWAALANTLFPSQNLQEGILKDLTPDVPWILRLRIVHPVLALTIGFYLVFRFYKKSFDSEGDVSNANLILAGVLSVALIFGMLTLLALSPVWMKLVHLTLAQVVWISIVNYVIISLLSTRRYKT